MSAGVWKDSYQAAVDGNLSLVEHHIREKVNSNYQHPEILRTPMVASCKLQGNTAMRSSSRYFCGSGSKIQVARFGGAGFRSSPN